MRWPQVAWIFLPQDGLATQAITTVSMNSAAMAKPGMMPARYSQARTNWSARRR